MTSRNIQLWRRACLVILGLLLLPRAALAQFQTINPTGGTDGTNGLRILAGQIGGMQVLRLNSGQWFGTASVPPTTNCGLKFAVGNVSFGPLMNQPLTAVSQSLSGTGSEADPWEAVTELNVGSTGFSLVWRVRYINFRDTFSMLVDVIPPPGNTSAAKLYFAGDTFLNGGDNGAAFVQPPAGTPDLLGVTKTGQFMVFINAGRPFDRWLSDAFGLARTQILGGGDYTNALNFNIATDNGIGVQWNLGVLSAPVRVPVNMAFTTVASVCGDGTLNGFETCDDSDASGSDGCSALCQVEPDFVCTGQPSTCRPIVCGDGLVEGLEACDDDGTAAGDGCSATCTVEAGFECDGEPSVCSGVCGDGIIRGAEGCDDDGTTSGNGCSATCTVEAGYACNGQPSVCSAVCGDGIIISPEGCDDSDTDSGDGCSAACRVEAGFACTATAQCAAGLVCDTLGSDACEAANTCGNGLLEGAEICDDGDAAPGGGCDAACRREAGVACTLDAQCGSGLVCDTLGSDTCEPANTCGNGTQDAGEACDDGALATGDGCDGSCLREAGFACAASSQCGSGLVCDTLGSDTCEAAGACGNGTQDFGEACDDGALSAGDGCDGACLFEAGFGCAATAQCSAGLVCDTQGSNTCEGANVCGNGLIEGAEACDDGGASAGGGCDAACRLELGGECTASAQCSAGLVCDTLGSDSCEVADTCGNGVIEGAEVCDDGGASAGGGCDAACKLELGGECTASAQCGAGLVCDTLGSGSCEAANTCGNGTQESGEACDDGALSTGDGCDGACLLEEGAGCAAKGDCGSGLVCDTFGSDSCEVADVCGNGTQESGEACDDGALSTGDGCDGACLLEEGADCAANVDCGSGLVCDTLGSDTCETENGCGNGALEAGEGCDDGGVAGADGCDASCSRELQAACTEDAECASGLCDQSVCKQLEGAACSADVDCALGKVCDLLGSDTCEPEDSCGNGAVDDAEACDDGGVAGGDGCGTTCLFEAGLSCTSDAECEGVCDLLVSDKCEPADTCGNGTLDAPEACDDGATQPDDGCSAGCALENGEVCTGNGACASTLCGPVSNVCEPVGVCGNGVLDEDEACDDGNTSDSDGCNAACSLELGQPCASAADCESGVCDLDNGATCEPADTCGNGSIDGGEACDDGGTLAADGCDAACLRELGETCGGAADCSSGVCDPTSNACEAAGSCGNAVVDAAEACDDGNTQPGDGCTGACALELGRSCTEDAECASGLCDPESGECEPSGVCGNGEVETGEGCDDGNTSDADGCSATCFKENGAECAELAECASGVCDPVQETCEPAEVCGNGVQETGEGCDDGGATSGDGCTSACLTELGAECDNGADCDSATCEDGLCVPPPECSADADCSDGERCAEGDCVAPESCESDADCSDEQVCTANQCSEPPAVIPTLGGGRSRCSVVTSHGAGSTPATLGLFGAGIMLALARRRRAAAARR